jgi:hypothetical protein
MSMLGRGLRTALGAINRPMPTKKAGRGAEADAKKLFDRDADTVLRSGIENLGRKDLGMDVDEQFKMLPNTTQTIANNLMRQGADGPSAVFRAMAQSSDEIDLEDIIDIAGADEVADSIITKLTDKDGAFQLSIDEVKDLAQVYQKSDVPNQRIMGELMTGMLEGNFDGPSMGALRNLPND